MSDTEPETSAPEVTEGAAVPESAGEAMAEPRSVDEELKDATRDGDGIFGRGEALLSRQAAHIASEQRASVIILAGAPNSGKTTLLAALYERFGLGKLAGHLFLGSRTLHGFEMRCHRSHFGKGPGSGAEGHTAGDAPPWLHLRTARQETPHQIHELLLGDFSGDHHFTPLANGTMKPSQFPALRRADHLCVAISGGALADPRQRNAEERQLTDLLDALLADPDGIAAPSAISFVVTKWDLVHAAGREGRDVVERLFEALRAKLPSDGRNNEVAYIETAARSTVSDLPIGYGIGDLLSRWTDRPALHITHVVPLASPTSFFDRFRAAP